MHHIRILARSRSEVAREILPAETARKKKKKTAR
jgi:hypothetical protein